RTRPDILTRPLLTTRPSVPGAGWLDGLARRIVTLPKKLLPPEMARMQEGLALELLGLIDVLAALRFPPLFVLVSVPALLPTCNVPAMSIEPPVASVAAATPSVSPPLVMLMMPLPFTFSRLPVPVTVAAPVPGAPMTKPVAFTLRTAPRESPGTTPPKLP